MRAILTILGILIAIIGSTQTIAVYPGVSYGRFYSVQKEEGHLIKNYKPQFGSYVGFEVKDISLDTLFRVGFAVNYQSYGGYFLTHNGGLGAGTTYEGEITKHVLGIEFYPINLRLARKLRINFGTSFNVLLSYKMSGNHSWWLMGTSPSNPGEYGTEDLNEINDLVKPYYWGFNSNIGYEFEVGKIIIEPRYNFYAGLSTEFNRLQAATRSIRNSFQISLGFKIE